MVFRPIGWGGLLSRYFHHVHTKRDTRGPETQYSRRTRCTHSGSITHLAVVDEHIHTHTSITATSPRVQYNSRQSCKHDRVVPPTEGIYMYRCGCGSRAAARRPLNSPLGHALPAEEVVAGKQQRPAHPVVADGTVRRPGLGYLFRRGQLPSVLYTQKNEREITERWTNAPKANIGGVEGGNAGATAAITYVRVCFVEPNKWYVRHFECRSPVPPFARSTPP